jgi:hypothetical protein
MMSYFTEFTPWLAGFLVGLLFSVHSRRLSIILPAALAIGVGSAFAAGELSSSPGMAFLAIVIDTLAALVAAVAARLVFQRKRRLSGPIAQAGGCETFRNATPTGAGQ